MSLSAAAKIGAGATLAIGTPTSLYFTWDHINYYEIERKIISGEVKLSVAAPNNSSTSGTSPIEVAKVSDSNSKWLCVIKAEIASGSDTNSSIESTDKTKLQTYIKKRIPTSESTTSSVTEEQKNANIRTLVRSCSSNRTKEDTSIESSWVISVKKSNSSLTVSFFGQEEQANETT